MKSTRAVVAVLAFAPAFFAGPSMAHAEPLVLDRVAVRFTSPDTGGVSSPHFIMERELAFEARVEALADTEHATSVTDPYRPRHIRAALERHIAETILESLQIDPEPKESDIAIRMESARLALYQRVGGAAALFEAARAEAIEPSELTRMLRRQARASLYLDRMVAPMIDPSDAELRSLHRTAKTPFSGQRFEEVEPALRRWYLSQRLSQSLTNFFEGARGRLKVVIVD